MKVVQNPEGTFYIDDAPVVLEGEAAEQFLKDIEQEEIDGPERKRLIEALKDAPKSSIELNAERDENIRNDAYRAAAERMARAGEALRDDPLLEVLRQSFRQPIDNVIKAVEAFRKAFP